MLGIVLRRLAMGVLLLWLVSVLVFAGTHLLPGDAAKSKSAISFPVTETDGYDSAAVVV